MCSGIQDNSTMWKAIMVPSLTRNTAMCFRLEVQVLLQEKQRGVGALATGVPRRNANKAEMLPICKDMRWSLFEAREANGR